MNVNLRVTFQKYTYTLQFKNVLNAIIGDSATGKTTLCEVVSRQLYKDLQTNASQVVVVHSIADVAYADKNALLLIDTDDILLEVIFKIVDLCRDDVCYCFFGRRGIRSLPLAVENTYILTNTVNKITNTPIVKSRLLRLSPFDNVLVEDSESGYKFFSQVFGKTSTSFGNGNINNKLESNQLVIFDSVGFGSYIEEFLGKAGVYSFPYVGYKSYEGFLLENIFNVTETPQAFNIEDALLQLLKEYKPDYSKSTGCTGDACSSCNLECKQSSKTLLLKSEYCTLVELYTPTCDVEALAWCRENAPSVLQELSDEELWESMKDIYYEHNGQ